MKLTEHIWVWQIYTCEVFRCHTKLTKHDYKGAQLQIHTKADSTRYRAHAGERSETIIKDKYCRIRETEEAPRKFQFDKEFHRTDHKLMSQLNARFNNSHFGKQKHGTSQVLVRFLWETPYSCSSSWIAHQLFGRTLILLYISAGRVVYLRRQGCLSPQAGLYISAGRAV